jgi:cyclophilin family peptidyl-prolyl cis-trans isomerase
LKKFGHTQIPDDPQHDPVIPFEEGTISYAGSGDNSRTSQLFISYGPSKSLGTQKWETPVGKMIEGMENVRNLYSGYGDGPPFGKGPAQGKIHSGPRYIEENFPLLDSFKTCTVEQGVKPMHPKVHVEKKQWQEPKRIRDEMQHEAKHHKKPGGGATIPRLNDERKKIVTHASPPRRSELASHAFAALAIIILVLLLVFGYRKSGRKGSKTS